MGCTYISSKPSSFKKIIKSIKKLITKYFLSNVATHERVKKEITTYVINK